MKRIAFVKDSVDKVRNAFFIYCFNNKLPFVKVTPIRMVIRRGDVEEVLNNVEAYKYSRVKKKIMKSVDANSKLTHEYNYDYDFVFGECEFEDEAKVFILNHDLKAQNVFNDLLLNFDLGFSRKMAGFFGIDDGIDDEEDGPVKESHQLKATPVSFSKGFVEKLTAKVDSSIKLDRRADDGLFTKIKFNSTLTDDDVVRWWKSNTVEYTPLSFGLEDHDSSVSLLQFIEDHNIFENEVPYALDQVCSINLSHVELFDHRLVLNHVDFATTSEEVTVDFNAKYDLFPLLKAFRFIKWYENEEYHEGERFQERFDRYVAELLNLLEEERTEIEVQEFSEEWKEAFMTLANCFNHQYAENFWLARCRDDINDSCLLALTFFENGEIVIRKAFKNGNVVDLENGDECNDYIVDRLSLFYSYDGNNRIRDTLRTSEMNSFLNLGRMFNCNAPMVKYVMQRHFSNIELRSGTTNQKNLWKSCSALFSLDGCYLLYSNHGWRYFERAKLDEKRRFLESKILDFHELGLASPYFQKRGVIRGPAVNVAGTHDGEAEFSSTISLQRGAVMMDEEIHVVTEVGYTSNKDKVKLCDVFCIDKENRNAFVIHMKSPEEIHTLCSLMLKTYHCFNSGHYETLDKLSNLIEKGIERKPYRDSLNLDEVGINNLKFVVAIRAEEDYLFRTHDLKALISLYDTVKAMKDNLNILFLKSQQFQYRWPYKSKHPWCIRPILELSRVDRYTLNQSWGFCNALLKLNVEESDIFTNIFSALPANVRDPRLNNNVPPQYIDESNWSRTEKCQMIIVESRTRDGETRFVIPIVALNINKEDTLIPFFHYHSLCPVLDRASRTVQQCRNPEPFLEVNLIQLIQDMDEADDVHYNTERFNWKTNLRVLGMVKYETEIETPILMPFRISTRARVAADRENLAAEHPLQVQRIE
ncbi:hypothetical protein PCE1_004595 [Barthelona sp. PCE]